MTELIDALKRAIKKSIGLEVIMVPQSAATTGARVELWFSGVYSAGEPCEEDSPKKPITLAFDVFMRSDGTHQKWIEETAKASLRLSALDRQFLDLELDGLKAYWQRGSKGKMEYTNEEDAMPRQYVEEWKVSIDFPKRFLGG